jgi:hypothetical protein
MDEEEDACGCGVLESGIKEIRVAARFEQQRTGM